MMQRDYEAHFRIETDTKPQFFRFSSLNANHQAQHSRWFGPSCVHCARAVAEGCQNRPSVTERDCRVFGHTPGSELAEVHTAPGSESPPSTGQGRGVTGLVPGWVPGHRRSWEK